MPTESNIFGTAGYALRLVFCYKTALYHTSSQPGDEQIPSPAHCWIYLFAKQECASVIEREVDIFFSMKIYLVLDHEVVIMLRRSYL